MRAGLCRHAIVIPIHRARHRSREQARSALQLSALYGEAREPVEAKSVSYLGTEPVDKMPPRFDFPHTSSRRISMTLTAAHLPAIVALIAGILILVMPRLLNFIVAIYLIFVGLVGLGVLKWLHF
jgi:hypothetical protein